MVWLREGGNWPESVLLLYFSRQWDHRPNGAVFWRWRRRCWMRHCVDCGWVVQTFLRKKKIPHWSAACRSWSHTAGCDRSIAVAAIVVRHLISWFCVFFCDFRFSLAAESGHCRTMSAVWWTCFTDVVGTTDGAFFLEKLSPKPETFQETKTQHKFKGELNINTKIGEETAHTT